MNDGSNDGSEKLVEVLAAQHHNLRLLHQENRGAPSARNAGLAAAKGTYVQFLDSDDFLSPNRIRGLLNTAIANDLDIITFGATRVEDHKTDCVRESSHGEMVPTGLPVVTGVEAERLNPQAEFLISINHFLVKKQLYDSLAIEFDSDLPYGDDTVVAMQLVYNAKRMMVPSVDAYNYVSRSSSLSRSRDKETLTSRVRCYRKAAERFHDINERYKARSVEGYDNQRHRISLFVFFHLYGTLRAAIPTPELRAGIRELRSRGLHPIGHFKSFGYHGFRHEVLRRFANTGWLFVLAHKTYHSRHFSRGTTG